jgi:hypothetical protein
MVWMIGKDVSPEPLACLPSLPGTYALVLGVSSRL